MDDEIPCKILEPPAQAPYFLFSIGIKRVALVSECISMALEFVLHGCRYSAWIAIKRGGGTLKTQGGE